MKIEFTESYKKFAIKVSKQERKPIPFDLHGVQKVVVRFPNGCVIVSTTKETKPRKILIAPEHYTEVIEED